MKLPPLLFALGYAGLIPFFAAPAWLALAPASAPAWLDRAWLLYAALITSFMAGTFWGLALMVIENPLGRLGAVIAAGSMLLTWGAALLPMSLALPALALVFLLLLAAELWRERALDSSRAYLRLRLALTVGVWLAIGWRYALLRS
ncbi:MAG: DUF3429 domain-containing protein [Gammaproteobacteria bacterium]|nr:DUF3429 domain-containing protein [Gammaproteobacteria bacterium]